MNIQISHKFRKSAQAAVFAIILFALVYFVLSMLALAISVGCFMLAIGLIQLKIHFATILIVLGLMSFGGLLGAFLFKFIFTSKKTDTSQFKLLAENEEPKLFAMVREISEAAGTSFPGKIFISPDVNAFVFYDSSFWSMFFPVKKNLVIGIGLMNTLTSQELKSILAHEFGHFSQRSMRVGSYVHQVQKVMHNILYENTSYTNFASTLYSIHPIVAFFINIAISVLKAMIWILKKIYRFVYLKYLALSREMEFHADQFAAEIAGSRYFQQALTRLEHSALAYQNVLIFYQQRHQKAMRPADLFSQHLEALRYTGSLKHAPMHCGFPQFDIAPESKKNYNRISFEENWSTHPENHERIAAVKDINSGLQVSQEFPAMELLSNEKETRNMITELMNSQVQYDQPITLVTEREFLKEYQSEIDHFLYDDMFCEYWDRGPLIAIDEKTLLEQPICTFDQLFNADIHEKLLQQEGRTTELDTLQAIANQQTDISTFIFEEKKYKASQALQAGKVIDEEAQRAQDEINAHGQKISAYFLRLAAAQNDSESFRQSMDRFKKYDENSKSKARIHHEVSWRSNQVFQGGIIEQIFSFINHLESAEDELRKDIEDLLKSGDYTAWLTPETEKLFRGYCGRQMKYFNGEKFDSDLIQYLFQVLQAYHNVIFVSVRDTRAEVIRKMTILEKNRR